MADGWRRFLSTAAFVGLVAVAAVGHAADRVALVIANSAYKEEKLRNPARDADAMAKALQDLDFTVLTKKDLNRNDMLDALLEFYRKLSEGNLALFYYAGHGLQVKGENYLVPIGARLQEEYDTPEECVSLRSV